MYIIDQSTYTEEGVTIKFSPCPITEQDPIQKYSFAVEEDEELTKKLIDSVKNKTVTERSIWYCAKALFEIIRTESFGKIVTDEEIASLFEKFRKEFGENPEFEIINLSRKNMPLWTAYLSNAYISVVGNGRTIDNARADAFKKCFIRYQETRF